MAGTCDREENAKRIYVTAPSDDRSGWLLFSEPDQLRHAMSAHIFPRDDESPLTESPVEETIQRLDQQYNKPYFKRRYQGAYLGRSIVRYAPGATQLYFSDLSTAIDQLDSLYPESLADDLKQLRNCLEEKAMLEALLAGHMQAAEGVIRHRGARLQKHEVPGAIEALVAELELDPSLLKRLEVESWRALLPEFELHPPSKENINDWMRVIDGWLNATVGGMSALQNAALEQLLVTESFVDQQYREGNKAKTPTFHQISYKT